MWPWRCLRRTGAQHGGDTSVSVHTDAARCKATTATGLATTFALALCMSACCSSSALRLQVAPIKGNKRPNTFHARCAWRHVPPAVTPQPINVLVRVLIAREGALRDGGRHDSVAWHLISAVAAVAHAVEQRTARQSLQLHRAAELVAHARGTARGSDCDSSHPAHVRVSAAAAAGAVRTLR